MTSAATMAPLSGRLKTRLSREVFSTRSSTVAVAVAMRGSARWSGSKGVVPASGSSRRPSPACSASARRCELLDLGGVVLGDERRPGVDGLAATDVVAVDGLQVEAGDSEEALDVGLLVDGEVDLARLDVGDDVLGEVERRDLGLRSGLVDRGHGVDRLLAAE